MKTQLVGALLWTFALTVAGADTTLQSASSPPPLDAMASLAILEGRWEGEGWMRQGPGEPRRFHGKETVERRLDGRLIIVEGVHSGGSPEHVVHHAFAVISHNPSTGRFRFQSFLADGRSGDYEGELKDGAFVWGFDQPQQGRMRFSIHVRDNQWHEIGESSRDGITWTQFFEMTLSKSKGM